MDKNAKTKKPQSAQPAKQCADTNTKSATKPESCNQ